MKMKCAMIAALFVALVSVRASFAADEISDQEFIKMAASEGMSEVETARMAMQKATHEDVKKFANTMVTDHSKANNQLKELATKMNVEIPAEVSAEDKAMHASLQNLSGAEFDRSYVSMEATHHQKDIDMLQKQVAVVQNAELKSWINDALPVVRAHLQTARDLSARLKGSAAVEPAADRAIETGVKLDDKKALDVEVK